MIVHVLTQSQLPDNFTSRVLAIKDLGWRGNMVIPPEIFRKRNFFKS